MAVEQNALLSVYDKTGIVEFGQGLAELDWTIYASGGTHRELTAGGVPAHDVAELVGGEAILGHRVVTLSREVHAGLLAERVDMDIEQLEELGIPWLDLVGVDMYPLAEAIAKPDATEESVINTTDIGGPAMLRSAAKGRRIAVSHAGQRPEVLKWLRAGRPGDETFLRNLAEMAEIEAAAYGAMSAAYIGQLASDTPYGNEHTQRLRELNAQRKKQLTL